MGGFACLAEILQHFCPLAVDDRRMFAAIIYVVRTAIQWNALSREVGASSTVYDHFRFWEAQGFFQHMWHADLQPYDELIGIAWDWQSVDSSTLEQGGYPATRLWNIFTMK